MLRNQVELLQTNDENLFGKEFSDYLTESVKSKKSSKEDFLKFLALRFNSNSIIAGDKSKSLRIIEAMKQNKTGVGAKKTGNFKKVASDVRVKVSPTHISSNCKRGAGKLSSINKTLVFIRDVKKAADIPPAGRSRYLFNKNFQILQE